ncbi:hypothetical protein [Methylocaldum sp.]|uniref:hypothetical protein n=1 Tax=Methylocaldum sp. TaxID=1969727 RepID=UPI002D6F3C90|nr:hypothetical protein [Methylocaldum sp.]HYE34969.1 hypothetical protein [Methylocaldum sp.]
MFNFSLIKIEEDGKLVASINNVNGAALYELTLDPNAPEVFSFEPQIIGDN